MRTLKATEDLSNSILRLVTRITPDAEEAGVVLFVDVTHVHPGLQFALTRGRGKTAKFDLKFLGRAKGIYLYSETLNFGSERPLGFGTRWFASRVQAEAYLAKLLEALSTLGKVRGAIAQDGRNCKFEVKFRLGEDRKDFIRPSKYVSPHGLSTAFDAFNFPQYTTMTSSCATGTTPTWIIKRLVTR